MREYSSPKEWLRALPKAELHLHLEGTITPETLVVLSKRHDSKPLTLDDARALYSYKDFKHFLGNFKLVCDRLLTPDDYALITREMLRDLASQGVVHAEVYISWTNMPRRGLNVEDVMVAIDAARACFKDTFGGPSILWIPDANRRRGTDVVRQIFQQAAQLRAKIPTIVGVGIGGDEIGGPMEWFQDVYIEAKKSGLRLTAHAGEATGSDQGPLEIRAAVQMGVERIGHGFAAQWDNSLMRDLADLRIPIEINVTSNIMTGLCQSVSEHPLSTFLKQGLLCVLNSDDPAMFGSRCLDEYVLVYKHLGLGEEDLKNLAKNSIMASFLGDDQKRRICAQTDRLPPLSI